MDFDNNTGTCALFSQENLQNMILPSGYIGEEQLSSMPMLSALKGSWGPLEWDVDVHIDSENILKSYFYIKISAFGINIVNARIDSNNPKIDVNLKIMGVGITLEVGVDFSARRIYLKGVLDFILYKKTFDITILNF